MKTKPVLALFAALLVAVVPAARGAGFLIYEHGAAAMAMGGAFTAVANNASAIWHNPAGIAWLEGNQVMLGATFIFPSGSVTMPNLGPLTIKQVTQVFTPPNFYFTHKFSDRVTAGIGFMAPFGLGTKWQTVNNSPPDFPLAYLGYYNDMQTFFVNPAIAIKLLDNLSLGLGCSYIFSSLKLDLYQRVGPFVEGGDSYDVPTAMKGTGNSFNFNAGLLYKGKGFSLGASYRSHFNIKYSGTVTLDNEFIPTPFQPYVPTSGDVKTTFKFPDILTFGLAIKITPKLLWSFDVHTYFWKRFDSYTADITFPSPFGTQTLTAPQNWKNSQCYRMGFEYSATKKLTLRLGSFFDETPQPVETMDPNLPDNDRWGIQGGLGYTIGKFTVDFGAHFEHFLARTSDNGFIFGPYDPNPSAGRYKTQALLLGLNFSYKF
ncbi:MAG TPA: outer membrane protein transport protein [Burkholderiales bacterium]|nr:outer membrane protein transport protein [Burkholderiales bacterium]